MRTANKIALLIMFFGMGLSAADFSLQLLNCPQEVVLGCPIYVGVLVKYLGPAPLVIAKGHGGFEINLGAHREDGKARKCMHPKQLEKAYPIPYHQFETLQPGWEREVYQDISKLCEDEKGVLLAWASVGAQGPFYEKRENLQREERKAWEGYVPSAEARILIVEPAGVDLEAFNAFKGRPLGYKEDLLARYPTSTYAGWLVFGGYQDIERKTTWMVDTLKAPQNVTKRTFDQSQNKWGAVRIDQLSSYLAARPDWHYADWMRLEILYWHVYRGEDDLAKAMLQKMEKVNKDNKPTEKAKELIKYLPVLKDIRQKLSN